MAETIVANPFVAYGVLVLVQLRVVWNYWNYRDLNPGDTAYYFLDAAGWVHGLREDMAFSPLYTAFFGTVLAVVRNVYAAAMIHRIAIVVAVAVLVLALMRSLVGPALGLLLALWWTVVPINFNALYEVHLFGLLPVLAAAVVAAHVPGRRGRGTTLAILLGATVIVRNELLVTTLIFAVFVVAQEFRARRLQRVPLSAYVTSYGVPLLLVCILVGGTYWRSHLQSTDLRNEVRLKSELAFCTAYAANLAQRHPAQFTGNPFTDCQPVIKRVYGRELLSSVQAAAASPKAFAAFAGWNAREVPGAVALGLFDATPTSNNPGYTNVHLRRAYALALSLLVAAIVIGGLVAVGRRWIWWRRWLLERVWPLAVVVAAAAGNILVVVFLERPWTEYTFALTIAALVVVGISVLALAQRAALNGVLAVVAAAVALGLAVGLPPYYHRGPRPIRDALHRLSVIQPALQQPQSVLVASSPLATAFCLYLAASWDRYCTGQAWEVLAAESPRTRSTDSILDRANATAIYADATLLADPRIASLVKNPRAHGWKQVAAGTGADGPWRVLIRSGAR